MSILTSIFGSCSVRRWSNNLWTYSYDQCESQWWSSSAEISVIGCVSLVIPTIYKLFLPKVDYESIRWCLYLLIFNSPFDNNHWTYIKNHSEGQFEAHIEDHIDAHIEAHIGDHIHHLTIDCNQSFLSSSSKRSTSVQILLCVVFLSTFQWVWIK